MWVSENTADGSHGSFQTQSIAARAANNSLPVSRMTSPPFMGSSTFQPVALEVIPPTVSAQSTSHSHTPSRPRSQSPSSQSHHPETTQYHVQDIEIVPIDATDHSVVADVSHL